MLAAAFGPALAAEPAKMMETSVGKVYVDAKGMTLYTFDKDQKGVSNCYDQCAVNWPPFVAGAKAKASGEWSLVDRKDGTKMWAYDGMPLYTFIKDKKSGDTTGDGVGGVWHVAK
jgi:predicted lipoprotein with Yx(FWY)xxD motif